MPNEFAVYLLDSTSYQLLATLPPQAGPREDATVTELHFLADGLSLVNNPFLMQRLQRCLCSVPISRYADQSTLAMQVAKWDGGAAVYSLAVGGLTWCLRLPITLLAVDTRCSRLALGTQSAFVVMMDDRGSLEGGLGLLGGCCLADAGFYQGKHNADTVGCMGYGAMPVVVFARALHKLSSLPVRIMIAGTGIDGVE